MANLAAKLQERIGDGSLSFKEWMEACLYDEEYGYYMQSKRKTGVGDDADFATSPTLHPFLGSAIGREIVDVWDQYGRPADFRVVEFGGGEGDLARQALDAIDDAGSIPGLQWTHVEISPDHQKRQETQDSRVNWATEMPQDFVGVVVAHEFLDALPFHWLEHRKGGWAEIRVEFDGEFKQRYGVAPPPVQDAAPIGAWAEGQRVPAMREVKRWLRSTSERLLAGAILVVDYGEHNAAARDRLGTVRTYKDHADAGSPFTEPGTKDITASIDFAQVRRWAEDYGLREEYYQSQEEWLLERGFMEAINAVDRSTEAGASQYLRMRQLLLPTGLGQAFKVQKFTKR